MLSIVVRERTNSSSYGINVPFRFSLSYHLITIARLTKLFFHTVTCATPNQHSGVQ